MLSKYVNYISIVSLCENSDTNPTYYVSFKPNHYRRYKMKTFKVSKVGQEILGMIAVGNVTTDDFTGARSRALSALRRGRLVAVRPVKVEGLALTPVGEAILAGKMEGSLPKHNKAHGVHRAGSRANKAANMIEKFYTSGRLARGKMIQKLVDQVKLTPASASTYIYKFGTPYAG